MFNNTSPEQEESRIPTIQDSYKLIERRASFSFQKKNFGLRQWIKIIILSLTIGLLTWYGKQASNNPFQGLHRIIISGNNKSLSIYSYRKDSVLAILPLYLASPLPATHPLPKNWNCISRTVSISYDQFHHPPKRWQIIEDTTITLKRIPPDWPSPRSFQENGFNGCSIKSIYPFNDHRTVLDIVVSGIRIFLIDASEFTGISTDTIPLQEASEILIIVNSDNESALLLRSALRPHFTIAFGNFDGNVPTYSNLFICGSSTATKQFIFKTTLKRNVVLEGHRKKSPHSR